MKGKKLNSQNAKTSKSIRQQRIETLMQSCSDEVLRQIIGPFGLTQAMFQDVEGGAVTTVHNFEKGVTANASDKNLYEAFLRNQQSIDRTLYDKDLPEKRKEIFQGSEEIISAYTGNSLTKDGQTHLDHVLSVSKNERDPKANLVMTPVQRAEMGNSAPNLVPVEAAINQSMGDANKRDWVDKQRKNDPGKTNGESFGIDSEKLGDVVKGAEAHVNAELLQAQIKKQGEELLLTGAEIALKNALRRAFGVVLFEFVHGSFLEISKLVKNFKKEENFIDRLTESLKRVMRRVIKKLKHALDAAVQGGVQGFISNLLTFMINNVITTSKKLVTVIRESMQGLWNAMKLLANPPQGQSQIEVARQVTKIIVGVVTTAIGMAMEESVKGFILSIAFLAPVADVLGTAIAAIMTGISGALIVYGIDCLFDWMASTDSQLLALQEEHADSQLTVIEQFQELLGNQFDNSRRYVECTLKYQEIQKKLRSISFQMETASDDASQTIQANGSMIDTLTMQTEIIRTVQLHLKNV